MENLSNLIVFNIVEQRRMGRKLNYLWISSVGCHEDYSNNSDDQNKRSFNVQKDENEPFLVNSMYAPLPEALGSRGLEHPPK